MMFGAWGDSDHEDSVRIRRFAAAATMSCWPPSSDPRLRGIAASTDAVRWARWDDYPVRATVLIVDDHAEFRQSAGALREAEGFAVIAEAADGNEP